MCLCDFRTLIANTNQRCSGWRNMAWRIEHHHHNNFFKENKNQCRCHRIFCPPHKYSAPNKRFSSPWISRTSPCIGIRGLAAPPLLLVWRLLCHKVVIAMFHVGAKYSVNILSPGRGKYSGTKYSFTPDGQNIRQTIFAQHETWQLQPYDTRPSDMAATTPRH